MGNCSGHGSCKFQDAQSLVVVKSCKVGDASCIAYCVCNSKYGGSTCSKTLEDMKASQSVRGQLLLGLNNLTKTEDLSPEIATSWFSNLGAITSNTDEISSKAAGTVGKVLSSVVSRMEEANMAIPPKSMAVLMDSLDNNVIIAKQADIQTRRMRLSSSSFIATATITAGNSSNTFPDYLKKPLDMVNRYGSIIVNDMVVHVCLLR